ncbi:hypothetical protein [Deinococcus sp. RIT780]|uniref:hypothetical protein n=1 Tax=Deinococcus sp. RIT780 TaxID=2870472 RepID=UPI001C8918E4|nr:hypothetical protein [Deinococcus sp. RIT780]MBX8465023.1 hypothetical protein [Deinococcus sp. RIT780]
MRQLATPVYMLIQSVFVIIQYQIAKLHWGLDGLNQIILILSAAIPFQLLNMGVGHYIYSMAGNTIGTKVQIDGFKTALLLSSIGAFISAIALKLFDPGLESQFITISAIYLVSTNLNGLLFLIYDGSGKSYLRSIMSGTISLIFLSFAIFNKNSPVNPIVWFTLSSVFITLVLSRPIISNWKQDNFDLFGMIKKGVSYNIMMLPSLSFDFVIKISLNHFHPALLPLFDLINKLLQQLNSLIIMLNQALAQKIKNSDSIFISKLALISGSAYFIFSIVISFILPFILDYIGITDTSNTYTVFWTVLIGWMLNTISSPWYFTNIFQGKILKNTFGNIAILATLILFGAASLFFDIPVYYSWSLALILGACVTVGYKNMICLFKSAPTSWTALCCILLVNLFIRQNVILLVISGVAAIFIFLKTLRSSQINREVQING